MKSRRLHSECPPKGGRYFNEEWYTYSMGKTATNRARVKPAIRSDRHASIVRRKAFSIEDLVKHVDPGSREEAEQFARVIYDQRRQDRERTLPE